MNGNIDMHTKVEISRPHVLLILYYALIIY